MNEYLEFFCMPGSLKIGSDNTGILSVMVKLNPDKLAEAKNKSSEWQLCTSMLKLLVAKIQETNMIYYFIFNVELVK